MVEQYPIVWMYHVLSIHSFVDGHLGSFYFWPMINDALINICVQVFFCGSICSLLLGIYIEVEFLGYMVILCSTF